MAEILGISSIPRAAALLARFFREPGRCLVDRDIPESDLVGVLALVWRVVLAFKILEVLPQPGQDAAVHKAILVLLILSTPQFAAMALSWGGRFNNGLVRLAARKDDLMAAKRAFAFSSILPNPFLAMYAFGGLLGHSVDPVVATFGIFGLCGVAGAFLECLALAKAYGLGAAHSTTVVLGPVGLTALVFFQIPLYLGDRLSPPIVKEGADLGLLEMHRFPVDSSVDGSGFLIESAYRLSSEDSTVLVSAEKDPEGMDSKAVARLEEHLRVIDPILRTTYFDKRNLGKYMPENYPGSEAGTIDGGHLPALRNHLRSLYLHSAHLSRRREHGKALECMDATMRLIERVGQGDLGLVFSITATSYASKLADLVDTLIPTLDDPYLLRRYSRFMSERAPDPEWVLNSLRQEYHLQAAIIKAVSDSFHLRWDSAQSANGFYLPGYTRRKLIDLDESLAISAHAWARILEDAKDPEGMGRVVHHEYQELIRWKEVFWAVLFRNIIGRILLVNPPELHVRFGRQAVDRRRHWDSVRVALRTKEESLEALSAQ